MNANASETYFLNFDFLKRKIFENHKMHVWSIKMHRKHFFLKYILKNGLKLGYDN